MQLVELDTDGDEFCLAVVPVGRLKALVARARAAGGRVRAFTGKRVAPPPKPKPAPKPPVRDWTFYARDHESWAVLAHGRGYDVEYVAAPRVKWHAFHTFADARLAAAAMRAMIAGWKADGFARISRAAYDLRPRTGTAYIGWRAPFPRSGEYFLTNKRFVTYFALDGTTLWMTGGDSRKRSFAESQRFDHFADVASAAAAAERERQRWHKPTSRAEVVKLYASSRPGRASRRPR